MNVFLLQLQRNEANCKNYVRLVHFVSNFRGSMRSFASHKVSACVDFVRRYAPPKNVPEQREGKFCGRKFDNFRSESVMTP